MNVWQLGHGCVHISYRSNDNRQCISDSANQSSYGLTQIFSWLQGTLSQSANQLFSRLRQETTLAPAVQSVVSQVCKKLSTSTAQPTQDTEAEFNQKMVQLCLNNKQAEAVKICSEQVEKIQTDGWVVLFFDATLFTSLHFILVRFPATCDLVVVTLMNFVFHKHLLQHWQSRVARPHCWLAGATWSWSYKFSIRFTGQTVVWSFDPASYW